MTAGTNRAVVIQDLDWNAMWKNAKQNLSVIQRHKDTIAFWDKRAESFEELMKRSNRAERYLPRINVQPGNSVLDIGSGPGTLAIPLAMVAGKVTVIEPSKGMLQCLELNAEKLKLKNIICINKTWEDVSRDEIGSHDVVIASHSFGMTDLKDALLKINDVAGEYVYLFVHIGERSRYYHELWTRLFGGEFKSGPDYIYVYNMLYDIGVYANVDIMDVEYRRVFSTLDAAVAYWQEIFEVPDTQATGIIKPYVNEILIKKGEEFEQKYSLKTAAIWWKKC